MKVVRAPGVNRVSLRAQGGNRMAVDISEKGK
jgi:hypothetical protein